MHNTVQVMYHEEVQDTVDLTGIFNTVAHITIYDIECQIHVKYYTLLETNDYFQLFIFKVERWVYIDWKTDDMRLESINTQSEYSSIHISSLAFQINYVMYGEWTHTADIVDWLV